MQYILQLTTLFILHNVYKYKIISSYLCQIRTLPPKWLFPLSNINNYMLPNTSATTSDNSCLFVWRCNFMTLSISSISVIVSSSTLGEGRIMQPVPIGLSDNRWSAHVNTNLHELCVDICRLSLVVVNKLEQVSAFVLKMKPRESPSNLVPPDMVQESMAHVQTATWFVFKLMNVVVPQDIHPNAPFWGDHSVYPVTALMTAAGIPQNMDKKLTKVC